MIEKALNTAHRLIEERYPNCLTAILGGSIIRGEGNQHSDLDIFVIDTKIPGAYRESLTYQGFPVEVFVHTLQSYKEFFKSDCERAIPSLPQIVTEGKPIVEHEITKDIVHEAKKVLKMGPPPWNKEKRRIEQYGLTDLLDDFEGSTRPDEDLFIAGSLAEKTQEFYLRVNNQWVGSSKWVLRALKRYNPDFADRFANAFKTFYKTGEKSAIINLVDEVLKPFGSRLFDGYSLGK